MRKGWRWEDIRFLLLLFLALAALLALNIFLARTLPGGEWLSLRWNGARAFMFEGIEPYNTAVAERVQSLVYGRTALASEYGYVLNDPFYIVLLYAPLAVFSDFSIARGIWMLFAEAALIGTVLLTLRLLEWQAPRWTLVCLFVFALFGYYSLLPLLSASPTIFFTFIYIAILLAFRSFNDELAGGLLALLIYQWEVGALFFLFVIVLIVANKRWAVLTGLSMALFVLLAVSFLMKPDWVLPYIRATLSDWYRGAALNFNSILEFWFPASKLPLGAIFSVVLLMIVFIEMLRAAQEHFRRITWVACLSLAATPLLGFPIFPSNYAALLPAFILILLLVSERWNRRQIMAGFIVFASGFLIPFGLYYASFVFVSYAYKDLLATLPPIAALLALYWMRWFAVRSPRTWFDQVGLRK
ncbi:MAG: hypothetical protein IT315_09735 [Anaerolineales bacterium]|nr:hypothetical protein [Anaerolineales bacterium]